MLGDHHNLGFMAVAVIGTVLAVGKENDQHNDHGGAGWGGRRYCGNAANHEDRV